MLRPQKRGGEARDRFGPGEAAERGEAEAAVWGVAFEREGGRGQRGKHAAQPRGAGVEEPLADADFRAEREEGARFFRGRDEAVQKEARQGPRHGAEFFQDCGARADAMDRDGAAETRGERELRAERGTLRFARGGAPRAAEGVEPDFADLGGRIGRKPLFQGRKSQVAGRKSQVAGRKSQVAGRKSQVAGRRNWDLRLAT